ncbi:REP-associated tyrosine transposase [Pseudomonas sp. NPDC007930]|uniref:REP-associated tyrosine transposase n=1 Tax=Pseudomonas sp. NPDC007930 TaxID=3364417 RepID=UPI0036ECDAA3
MNPKGHSTHLRRFRTAEVGRLYCLTFVTHQRRRLFSNWPSAKPVIDALKQAQAEGKGQSLAWVVMPDHVHWLVRLQARALSELARKLKSRATVGLRARGVTGPVWQDGYYDQAIRNLADAVDHARYIVLNPVRAGLVSSVRFYPMWDSIWVGDPEGVFGMVDAYVLGR